MTDLKAINNAVRETCLQVAGFIQHESEGFSADKIEHKGFNDLVSYVDKESEQMLVKACKKYFPPQVLSQKRARKPYGKKNSIGS